MGMWKKWWAIALMLCGLSMGAQAQRMAVPVVDFVNVPVATHAGRVLDAGQVYQAIATAAAAERWDLVKVRDGVVHAAFRRGDQHRIVVEISYSAEAYSVRYLDSFNMKFEAVVAAKNPAVTPTAQSAWTEQRYGVAAERHAAQYADRPETAYAVARKDALIHPFYERWVRMLIGSIGRQLKVVP